MTDQERQTLANIARRLLRDGHISDVEAAFISRLLVPQRVQPDQQSGSHQEQPGPDQ